MRTELWTIDTPERFETGVRKAAEWLARGEIVAVPTETVYGLAANALEADAVQRIYEAKGRPSANPIIVHVGSVAMARDCAADWPEAAAKLAKAFWPGPLTMVVPKSRRIPSVAAAGGDTVGLRWPAHPFMRELIQLCGFPLAAPSANRSNELSPTTGEHVLKALGGKIPLIIDAGASNVGIESTVVDLCLATPRILRAGMISDRTISEVLGQAVAQGTEDGEVLKSPGLLKKHYSPRARLVIVNWRDEAELQQLFASFGIAADRVHVITYDRIPRKGGCGRVVVIPNDAEAYARALYAELHSSDALGAELILVEAVPSGEEWQGIRDRLTRASAGD
jgi:L-threonylcarbamoyladenylate synthase